jgi:hypothetical protein
VAVCTSLKNVVAAVAVVVDDVAAAVAEVMNSRQKVQVCSSLLAWDDLNTFSY